MTNPNPLLHARDAAGRHPPAEQLGLRAQRHATVQYTLPQISFAGRVFSLQLYNESSLRGKRIDQLIATYGKWTSPQSNTVQFQFTTPKVTVRHTQIWLLALYGAQLPPGATASPSPSPSSSGSPAPSSSP